MKRKSKVMSTLGLIVCLASYQSALGAGGNLPGSGSANDPYMIEDLADFSAFTDTANSATYWSIGVHTKLACDIELYGNLYGTAVIAPALWNSTEYEYQGVFDGDGNVVKGLNIKAGVGYYGYYIHLGLFGKVGSNGEIKNLGVEDITINSIAYGSYGIGSLCGSNYGSIDNCYAKTGTITLNEYYISVGGLCGASHANSSINNSYAIIDITGGERAEKTGGLCGSNDGGTINGCYTEGSVTVGHYSGSVGGLCGENKNGTIYGNCYATGNVIGGWDNENIGGLCGYNNLGGIINSYATGQVTADDISYGIGGLCGQNRNGSIYGCDANGQVSAGSDSSSAGGLCGQNWSGQIYNCSASGLVTGEPESELGSGGGLCGSNYQGTIGMCQASGNVIGSNSLGGLCGSNSGNISDSSSSGDIFGVIYLDPLCGWNSGTIVNSIGTGSVNP